MACHGRSFAGVARVRPVFHIVLCLAALGVFIAPALAAPAKLADVLQPFVDNHKLAGAVTFVASKDKVLSLEAVGYAEVAARKPMKTDALFWIASQSNPITATALMLLVDEGKVNVDDPVEKYLPEFKGQWVIAEQDKERRVLKRPKHPITVRNILSHTSGLPFKSGIEEPTLDLYPLSARVRSYAMTPLEFEPDSKYQYSNDPEHQPILIFLVQHAGWPNACGKEILPAFQKAAVERFGK